MSEAKLLWSFPPVTLAQELARRYSCGTQELQQFIDHYAKRAQLEDSLVSTIEKATKHGALRSGGSVPPSPGRATLGANAVAALQGEVDAQARLHLHLAERINNEVVRPLEAFRDADAWRMAQETLHRVQGMAEEMRTHREHIPRLSTRASSRSQHANERLENEKRKLFGLQQLWQTEIASLVANFEAADVARIEIQRESVLKFEHYQNELFKAAQGQTVLASEAAARMSANARVIDVLGKNHAGAQSQPEPHQQQQQQGAVYESGSEDRASSSKSFLKLGIFRSKTRRIRKKGSGASQSGSSAEMSPEVVRSGSASIPGVRATYESDGRSPVSAAAATVPESTGRRRSSLHSSISAQQHQQQLLEDATRTKKKAASQSTQDNEQEGPQENIQESTQESTQGISKGGAGELGEWVLAGNSQQESPSSTAEGGEGGPSAESLVHVTHLSAIDETSDKSQSPPAEPTVPSTEPSTVPSTEPAANAEAPSTEDKPKEAPASMPDSAENGELRFEDVFTSLEKPQPRQADVAGTQAEAGSSKVDLDSAFSVPPASKKAAGGAGPATPSALFPSATVTERRLSQTDASNAHRRNASMGVASSPSFAGPKVADEGGSDEEELEQAFKVNFSIRDRAIQDNPEDTKAALTRVATMLRSAPSSGTRRRNRREVRTMYVPSDAPMSDLSDAPPPKEAEDKDQLPLAPMQQKSEEEGVEPERDIPVATATVLDSAAAEETEDTDPAVAAAKCVTSTPTKTPEADGETPEAEEAGESQVTEVAEPPSQQQRQKSGGSVRRRARPPPPPPPATGAASSVPGSRSRSLKRPSMGNLGSVEAGANAGDSTDAAALGSAKAVLHHRPSGGRRAVASGPVAIGLQVNEILDFTVEVSASDRGLPATKYQVTGEITVHIQKPINPLELAPLRIRMERPADNIKLMANPQVVVPDSSSSRDGDSGEWFRFVRPDLFAQVGEEGERVTVFKYLKSGQDDLRVMPLFVRSVCTASEGMCAVMLFCEPNVEGRFAVANNTVMVDDLAALLRFEGQVDSQASRPTGIWFQGRNTLLWRLDPMPIPAPGMADSELLDLSRSLAIKATGSNELRAVELALRFVVRNTRIVDIPVSIVKVSSSGSAKAAVVGSLTECVVKSGKCIYTFLAPNEGTPTGGEGAQNNGQGVESTSESEAWSGDDDS
ncbi:hypothetical protein GGF46_000168 [Coemansia sp. RSA 552]|nr:hypothetical protein GGF46_000168 [Coemansia sp. RSA 552]